MNQLTILSVLMIIGLCSRPMVFAGDTCMDNYIKLERSIFGDLLNAMMKLKHAGGDFTNSRKRPTVAFSASLSKAVTLKENEVVKFDNVWTNIENGYNKYTGVFTAPVRGAYQFSCTAVGNNANTVRLQIFRNGQPTVVAYSGWKVAYGSGSAQIILELKQGDTVDVRRHKNNTGYVYSESSSQMTMFSGFLV